jgi:hypothetical protein
METRGVKEVVTINENGNPAAIAQLPRDIVSRIKIVHLISAPT